MNALALAAGYSSDSDSESGGAAKKNEGEQPKEDSHRPGFGRGYFASAQEPENTTDNAESSSSVSERSKTPEPGKKRALPKASDLLSSKITPAFIAHTVASIKQDATLRVGHVKLEERPVEPPPKKRGLLDIYEEKKLKHKAISSKYHVPESERADFVEPSRVRNQPSKETGDIGWLEVFARRSKRSFAPKE